MTASASKTVRSPDTRPNPYAPQQTPPAARTVWASRRCRLPTTSTWLPASVAAIAARSPAAPEPMTSTLQTRLRADDSGISFRMLLRRLKTGLGPWLRQRALQFGEVLDQRGKILLGDAQHRRMRDGADGRRPVPVAEESQLPEMRP